MKKRRKRRLRLRRVAILAVIVSLFLVVIVGTIFLVASRIKPLSKAGTKEKEDWVYVRGGTKEEVPEEPPATLPEVKPRPETIYYDVPLDRSLQDWIGTCLKTFNLNIDSSYILALIENESGYDPYSLGAANDCGYTQLLAEYFSEFYLDLKSEYPELEIKEDVWDEKTNIAVGIHRLNKVALLLTGRPLDPGNYPIALTGYNRGVEGAKAYYGEYGTFYTEYTLNTLYILKEIEGKRLEP